VFNEKTNAVVWQESIRQVTEMIEHWEEDHSRTSSSRQEFLLTRARQDILKFSLNVICGAGFGVKLPYKPTAASTSTTKQTKGPFEDANNPPLRYQSTFRSAIEHMSNNLSTVFLANGILPKWFPQPLVPFFKKDFEAYRNLGKYLHALVSTARENKSQAHNLIDAMVKPQTQEQKNARGLSDAEILANMYMFTLAGHETTATTLRFALVLLALHQDVQDWLFEEIQEAIHDEPLDPAQWDYATVFPKLVNSLCVMVWDISMSLTCSC
jgi:cytochrome P450